MIYLDNNATTKIDPRVLGAMMPYLTDEYGNAASNHEFGVRVNSKVKEVRSQISYLLGAERHEVLFTSGATEAINLGIKGLIKKHPDRNHIITVQTEHKAVLDVCKYLEKQGVNVSYLPVKRNGLIDLMVLRDAITPRTLMVCVMLVNNETGVIQPLKAISEIAHEKEVFLMSDGTQAVGKIPVDVNELGVDIMAFSGHKIYGPKGVGGLYVRSRRPNKVRLEAIIHGGGHERQMRSGTLNVPGIVGLGAAAVLAQKEMGKDAKRIRGLRDQLEHRLLQLPDTSINGDRENRLYNVCNICFKNADADAIMVGMKSIIVSNGSACTSTEISPSHVLMAMGLTEDEAYSSLRISLGRYTTQEDIELAGDRIVEVVSNLRSM